MAIPTTKTASGAAPARRLSDLDLRNGCVAAALAVLVGFNVYQPSFARDAGVVYVTVLLQTVLGVAVALLLHRALGRRSLPVALLVVIGVVGGIYTFERLGWRPIDRFWAIAIVEVCVWTPWMMLLALAAICAVPSAVFEAAAIDRASAWFAFRNVTLPLIAPLLLGGVIVRTGDAFRGGWPFTRSAALAFGTLVAGIVLGELVVRVRRWMSR